MREQERTGYYLVCPAGIPNYGDELIAATWLGYLAESAPHADVVVDCIGPEAAARRLAGIHPRTRFHNVLWQLCVDNLSPDSARTAAAVAEAVREPAAHPALADGLAALLTADVVHLLGGGFINGIWPPFVGLLSGIATAAQRSGGRAAMTGQGLWPPAEGADAVIRSLAKDFDVVDVRDAASAGLLGAGSGVCSSDDVFLGAGPGLFHDGDDVPDVMVSVQSLLNGTEPDELARYIAKVVRGWGAQRVGLLECAPTQDAEVLAVVRRALPGARTYAMTDVLARGLPVRPGQAWLSTRFHPHLVAAAGGASGVALSVRPDYYGTKHRSLTDGGSNWRLLEGLEVPDRPAAGGYRPETLVRLRAAKRALAARIYGDPAGDGGRPAAGARSARPGHRFQQGDDGAGGRGLLDLCP
ncbi:polysaccharide pyruvyl transferase family protein [Streptomyces nondiastaticus]|uniref:polysaccharide pyruvyl transferase family protein n=1 Tax=Streptomyces nondiastaticus TaxID=3154512 RepID=UPI0034438090